MNIFVLVQCSLSLQKRDFQKGFRYISKSYTNLGAVVTAVLDDSLHLFVYELHTPQTGLLQTLHLSLHQQLKRHLRHKQSRTWTLHAHKRYITLLSSQYPPEHTTTASHGIKVSDATVCQVLHRFCVVVLFFLM